MRPVLLILTAFLIICNVDGHHFVVGNVAYRVMLAYHTNIKYNAIPFIKRVKEYFYSSPVNKIIVGIEALDNLHSKASINITAGGVGFPFVNLRLKSDRGWGLNYDVGIFVSDSFY